MEEPIQEYEIPELPQVDLTDNLTDTLQDLGEIVEEIDLSNVIQ